MSDAERRQGPRIPVKMWVEESGENALYFQRAANLSQGGIFLENTIPHPVGTVINLEFTLPGEIGPSVRVRGEIVNAATGDNLGMGIKFIELPRDVAERIDAFVAKQSGEH